MNHQDVKNLNAHLKGLVDNLKGLSGDLKVLQKQAQKDLTADKIDEIEKSISKMDIDTKVKDYTKKLEELQKKRDARIH